jgi:Ca2+:H+ antiporter
MPGPNEGTNGSADERTPLTRGSNSHSGGKPLHEDDRAWVRYPMSFFHLAWLTLASNYVNILLVFVPAGIALGATGANPTTVFIINFIAIVPLASLLSFATEELSVKLGQTIGGLMNATFGNAVELIVCLTPKLE